MGKFVLFIIIAALVIAFPIGWVINAYKFCKLDFEGPYKAEVVRGVGIFFPPVGVVTGLLVTFDEEVK